METDLFTPQSKVLYRMSFEKEKFNLKKVLALEKRLLGCELNETTQTLLKAVELCKQIEKEKSEKNDKERRLEYQLTHVECPFCFKELLRASLYKHKNICKDRPKQGGVKSSL